jgi:hypothetical protein
MGGYLVSITTVGENKFISGLLSKHANYRKGGGYFMGSGRSYPSVPWQWSNGEDFDFSKWAGASRITDGVYGIVQKDGQWWQQRKSTLRPYICDVGIMHRGKRP